MASKANIDVVMQSIMNKAFCKGLSGSYRGESRASWIADTKIVSRMKLVKYVWPTKTVTKCLN